MLRQPKISAALAMLLGIALLSQSGNLVRMADTSPLTVAFYRCFLAFVFISPLTFWRTWPELKKLNLKQWLLLSAMGAFFALHLCFWIMAVQYAKIANAAIFFAMSPLLVTIGAMFFLKEAVHKSIFFAFILSFIGLLIIGWGDLNLSPTVFKGDLLALTAAFMFAGYILVGRFLRGTGLSNWNLMTAVYALATLTGLPVIYFTEQPLSGFSLQTWAVLIMLVLVLSITAHGALMYSLKHIQASTMTNVKLIEPVLAGTGAYFIYHETLGAKTIIGYLFIVVGMLFVYKPLKNEISAKTQS